MTGINGIEKNMSRELEYHNARITSTRLGFEDHGIMTFSLGLEFKSGGVSFGGYALDIYDKEKDERVGVGEGLDCLKEIMETVGVETWEDLKGKYVVLESGGWGGQALGIRNVLDEDKWFRPKEFFESRLTEVKERLE